ncbi:hypothetical protein H4C16_06525 [Pseudomonas monteilii]|nr:hypothetical protein [Pseudomonas monteilii]MBZ3663955.1 hypothetical protein [Pseudomonas monteilii]MBZ3669300.1 hypothetical protein [Pseudomonas monteilii]
MVVARYKQGEHTATQPGTHLFPNALSNPLQFFAVLDLQNRDEFLTPMAHEQGFTLPAIHFKAQVAVHLCQGAQLQISLGERG